MKMTREHYEELAAKRDSEEELTDEDRRFLKMYESPKPSGGPVAGTLAYDLVNGETQDAHELAEEVPYEDLKVAELKTEIAERNKDRADEDKIDPKGTKEELVDRLYADDESGE